MNKTRNSRLTGHAQALRRNMTPEERHLWYDFLKEQPFETHRQKVIGRFIVDFCICKPKIVIEIDGFQHGEDELRRKDEIRDAELEVLGYTVLRYSNRSIKKHFKDVCQDIWMSVYPDGREDENI